MEAGGKGEEHRMRPEMELVVGERLAKRNRKEQIIISNHAIYRLARYEFTCLVLFCSILSYPLLGHAPPSLTVLDKTRHVMMMM